MNMSAVARILAGSLVFFVLTFSRFVNDFRCKPSILKCQGNFFGLLVGLVPEKEIILYKNIRITITHLPTPNRSRVQNNMKALYGNANKDYPKNSYLAFD